MLHVICYTLTVELCSLYHVSRPIYIGVPCNNTVHYVRHVYNMWITEELYVYKLWITEGILCITAWSTLA